MAVTDLTGYTWVANDSYSQVFPNNADYFINFTSNSQNFVVLSFSTLIIRYVAYDGTAYTPTIACRLT